MTKEDFDLWINSPLTTEFRESLKKEFTALSDEIIYTRFDDKTAAAVNEARGRAMAFFSLSDPSNLEGLLVKHEGVE